QFRMVPLALQLGDDHQRKHYVVFVEPGDGPGVGQEDRGVEDVATCIRERRAVGRGAGGGRVGGGGDSPGHTTGGGGRGRTGGGTSCGHGFSLAGTAPRPHWWWAGRPCPAAASGVCVSVSSTATDALHHGREGRVPAPPCS